MKLLKIHLYTPLLLMGIFGDGLAQDRTGAIRELWVGTFKQSGPLHWEGKMELYITYQPAGGEMSPVKGIITWHGEKPVRTEVEGTKDYSTITFREARCLQKSCAPFILGGSYHGSFDERYLVLTGSASLHHKDLKGKFLLKRVVEEED